MWTLIDGTSKGKGYLRLECDGKRVADFFPFAPASDEMWVKEQAQLILRTLNGDVHKVGEYKADYTMPSQAELQERDEKLDDLTANSRPVR